MLPLTAIRFGSRTMTRPTNNLPDFIKLGTFRELFLEFNDYDDLSKHVSSVREDQRRVRNRWQTYLPRLLQIRVLINEYISLAETLVADHSDYQGLREYAIFKKIEYWHAESRNGILHEHEAQYLYTFRHFLTDQQHYDLAKQTHQLLISRFEHASDLWTLVTTILDRLVPQSIITNWTAGHRKMPLNSAKKH